MKKIELMVKLYYNNAMPTPNIQNNKYTPSPLPEICAPRGALMSRLSEAANQRLIFVSAPGGFGKTVTALMWAQASGRKTVWIGLDAFDNSVAIFYKLFSAGILSTQPANMRMEAILQDPAFESSPIEHTIRLLSEFQLDESEYVLAMDDFHTLTNPEILKSLPFILKRLPHSFITFILSRMEPVEYFAELIEEGQAMLFGTGDLVFSIKEIETFFRLLGRKAAGKEAKSVLDSTGGWAIGVNALAHSADSLTNSKSGSTLDNFIQKRIWKQLDESLKSFLLASAVLDEMPVGLCAEVTGRSDAEAILEGLRLRNSFVTRIEDDVYRYHHLFLDFLRAQPEYGKADKVSPRCAAAEYYAAKGEHAVARYYAYESSDIETILSVMDTLLDNRGLAISEYMAVSRDFFLSPSVSPLCEKCPPLYIFCAWTAFAAGEAAIFGKILDALGQNLTTILDDFPLFGETAVALLAMDFRLSFAAQIERAMSWPPIKFKDNVIRLESISMQMPYMHRSVRDFSDMTDWRLFVKQRLTFAKLLKEHNEAMLKCVRSALLLEQNNLGEALEEAQSIIADLDDKTIKDVRFMAYMHLSATYLALNQKQPLNEILDKTAQFVEEEASYLRPNFLAFTTRIKLWQGGISAAREWLGQYFISESSKVELYRIYQHFTTIRAYIVLGEFEKAKNLTMQVRKMGQEFFRPQDAAEAAVLLAVVLWLTGKKEEAQGMMETALLEMHPYLFVRLIADEGAAVLPILKKVTAKLSRGDNPSGLDPIYVNSVYLAAYSVSRQRGGLTAGLSMVPPKLSGQQHKILTLLAKGYKREDIIKETGLSLSTVKTHTRLLYEKLAVSSAADAVLRARELGIIE
jgi:LuxR family maltose regulon positive regulatory protein